MQRSGLWTLALAVSTAGLMTASLPSNAQELESRVLELEQELMLMKTQLTSQVKQAQEAAAKAGGNDVQVSFTPGRTDASAEQTDVDSFAVLEPTADGFRNYLADGHQRSAEELLVDRAHKLTLTAPEMTVLVGGMRVLNANTEQSERGVLTKRPELLTNDFFVNLLDVNTKWQTSSISGDVFEGRDQETGEFKWTATAVDLVFGSNSQLRAIAEVYACDNSEQTFVREFVVAWEKVMNLDRFDLA